MEGRVIVPFVCQVSYEQIRYAKRFSLDESLTFPQPHDFPAFHLKYDLPRQRNYLKDFPACSCIIIYKNGCRQVKTRLWPAKHQESRLYYLVENSKYKIFMLLVKTCIFWDLRELSFVFREFIFWYNVAKICRQRSIRSILNFRELFLTAYVLQWKREFS